MKMKVGFVRMLADCKLGVNDTQTLQILPGNFHHDLVRRLFFWVEAKDRMKAGLFLARPHLLLVQKILGHDFEIMSPNSFGNQDLRSGFLADIPAGMIEGIRRDRLADHGFNFFRISSRLDRYPSKYNIARGAPSW